MAYSRIFIALNQCCSEYAKDIRGCVGKCVIEIRNGFGRLVLQVQGLNSEVQYRAVILSSDNFCDISIPLYIDGSGKGEIRWSFKPMELGFDVNDIRAVAVLVADKAPLIGFTRGEYNWQSCLMAKEVKAAKIDTEKAEVISIIEEFDNNINEIKAILSSDVENNNSNVDYIFSREHIKPFGDDGITWVKASIKEMPAIKDLWKYANNPFVVQCCCEYKHILLGRDNESFWLGLPCKYDKSYTLEAKLQGFKGYKATENNSLKDNEFCYCLLRC